MHAYVLLNLYPYNSGHLLVCPYRHVADYTDLTADEAGDVAALTQRAMTVVRAVSRPDGFNIGINLGRCAGAGLPEHIHVHVVPRWNGDRVEVPVKDSTEPVTFVVFNDHEMIAKIVGDPLATKVYIL